MEIVGIFYGPMVCLMAIWYILSSFGIFWVCTKKNLATLARAHFQVNLNGSLFLKRGFSS
jgi:hypothetical protein